MNKNKKREATQKENFSKKTTRVNEEVLKSNRALLWAIFVFLVILVGLVSTFIVTNIITKQQPRAFNQEKIQNRENTPPQEIANPIDTTPTVKPPAKPSVAPPSDATTQPVKPKPKTCKAKNFDGKKYDDGESYTTLDGCKTCTCDDGDWNCVVKPSCIILPSDCTFNNHVYHDGETRSAECDQTCTCDSGNWNCVMAPGSSCCQSGNKIYHNNESFPADDGCNTCTCHNGSISCTMMLCL